MTMPYFVIYSQDIENSLEKRMSARPAHIDRLKALNEAGRLLVAGPCPLSEVPDDTQAGFSGSVVIAAFTSLKEAKQWADADPYIEAGVYQQVEVKPYKPVLGSALENS